jgi:hypothetical protein
MLLGHDAGPTPPVADWVRRRNVRLRVKTLLVMQICPILLNNSLIQLTSSLFFEKSSLLICLGNCSKSHCSAVVSSHETGYRSLKIAKFPVKFPVSREIAWRPVRSALRRQPTSPAPGDSTLSNLRNARQWRAFANWQPVSRLRIWPFPTRNSR